jgi:small subunit ribosomal protein S16
MVKIRLMRMGARKNPHYRVVVADARNKRGGAYIESLGYFDPRGTVAEPLKINTERAQYWLGTGAQPTETAIRLLEKAGAQVGEVRGKRAKAYTERAHGGA